MKLLFLSNVCLYNPFSFSQDCIGVLSIHLQGVRTVDLIIFTIGTYWFDILSIIKSLMDPI